MTEEALAGRRVLIVGGGLIGGSLAARLPQRGATTLVLSRSRRPLDRLPDRVTLVQGDASDHALVASVLEDVDDVVYCAGSLLPAALSVDARADIAGELLPLRVVLEAIREAGRGSIAYVSSGGAVYGRARYLPIDEDHPTEPLTTYGHAKLAGENLALRFGDEHGIPTRILRCANVFGDDQRTDRGHGAVKVFLDHILRDEPITLFGDGSVVRDYVHVADVADVVADLLRLSGGARVLNLGSGVGTSLRELIQLCEAKAGRRARIVVQPARSFDVPVNVLDVRRLEAAIGRRPAPLPEGLDRMLALHVLGEAAGRA